MNTCRSCGAGLGVTMLDLGDVPPPNDLRPTADEARRVGAHRLRVRVCGDCRLAQLDETVPPEVLFSNYSYFSSFSDSWLAHARSFAEQAVEELGLGPHSAVVEVASNDGYLLRWFGDAGVDVLGVEPAANVADAARAAGIPTIVDFFDRRSAAELRRSGVEADLVVANNVLAHVPDPNEMLAGVAAILRPGGCVSVEVPHLLRLLERTEFDTVYHEHYSYFSLLALEPLAERHGLRVVRVEELPTHGGSLRLRLRRIDEQPAVDANVARVRAAERTARLDVDATYTGFADTVRARVDEARTFLRACAARGEVVVGYGAAAKATILLTAAGIGPDLLPCVGDRSPHKIGRYLPGTGIPVVAPDELVARAPAVVLVLAWNLLDEVVAQLSPLLPETRFVTAIPQLQVHGCG